MLRMTMPIPEMPANPVRDDLCARIFI